MKTIKQESMPGMYISQAIQNAVDMARKENCIVEFDFNGIVIQVSPTSDPAALSQSYFDECTRRHEAYIQSPGYLQQMEDSAQRQHALDAALKEALASAPEHMTLRDAESWKLSCEANKDGYGGAVMTYAETWARLMEARMSKGELIAQIADECSHLADNEGITGFMYGCAVQVLAKVWIHGEALRLWHNLKAQIGTEGKAANDSGGVLNPAILSIG